MATSMPGALRFAGCPLGPHRHVCAFFTSPEEEYRILLPFLREGLARGERAVYILPDDRHGDLARMPAGVDVAAGSGTVEVRRSSDSYLRNGRFDGDAMLGTVQEILESGRAAGFPLTRLAAHAEQVAEAWESADAFVEYEARLNFLLPRYPDPVICSYDAPRIGAAVMLDALRTHPLVLIAGVLQDNPYYVPPDVLLQELRVRGRLARGVAARAPDP